MVFILVMIVMQLATLEVSAIIQGPSFGGDPSVEQPLIARLLGTVEANNNPRPRPASMNGKALHVNITLSLFQLIEVNQRLNTVTLSGSLTMEWTDPRMSWDPAANANIQILHLPYTSVWKPDIYAYFGFDRSVYSFSVFGSWSYENRFIEFRPNAKVDLTNFYDNQEWLLDQTIKVAKSHLSSLKAGNFSTVTMTYRIRRQSFYYVFNLVIPATVVTVTSVIGIHAPTPFRAPRSSRFQLGIVTLLPMGVLLLTIVNDLPKFALTSVEGQRGSFSGVPLLGVFYLSQILTISVCTITYSLFVALERYGRQGHAVPWPLTWLLSRRERLALVKGWYYADWQGIGGGIYGAVLLSCCNSDNYHYPDEDRDQRRAETIAVRRSPINLPYPTTNRKDRFFIPAGAANTRNSQHQNGRLLMIDHSEDDGDGDDIDNNIGGGSSAEVSIAISPTTGIAVAKNRLSIDTDDLRQIDRNSFDMKAGRGEREDLRTRKARLYDQWETIIGRLERFSLFIFLLISATIVLFFNGWR